MLQTVVTAGHILVQGEFVKQLSDGQVMVRVGSTVHVGRPVRSVKASRKGLKAVKAA